MESQIPALLKDNAASSAVFELLSVRLAEIGPFNIEEKKTSLHITNDRAAFLGVHPRSKGLRLNIVLPNAIASKRIAKVERISANRWHNEIDLDGVAAVDSELMDWIRQAYLR